MFFPALFLWNYGTAMRDWFVSGKNGDIERAFKENKSYWKFNGIVTIIGLAIIPVMFIVAIVAGIAIAMNA